MIEREGGAIVFHCDKCPDCLETEESDFNAALHIMSTSGWVGVKIKSEWLHFCPGCKLKMTGG